MNRFSEPQEADSNLDKVIVTALTVRIGTNIAGLIYCICANEFIAWHQQVNCRY